MKKFSLFTAVMLFSMFSALSAQAQVSITVSTTAGNLSTALTVDELATVTNLTLSGSVDARDFKTMRDAMPVLVSIDLSTVTVATYTGTDGTLPNDVTYPANELPQWAFCDLNYKGKTSLTDIKLPVSLASIGDLAFSGCQNLTSVAIPTSVASIGDLAFVSCYNITSITIPVSVTSIGVGAFEFCDGLTSVMIPASVTSIGVGAFSHFRGLIIVDIDNLIYSSADGILFDKAQTRLIQCPITKTGSYIIPATVTSIEHGAFLSCSDLTIVTIPSSILSIGSEAFYSCNGLTTVNLPNSVTSIGSKAFSFCDGLTSITIPASVTSIVDGAFYYFRGLINVEENNLNYSSTDGVLFDKAQTRLIQCPVTKKGSYVIPSSIISIGNEAFSYCSSLASVTISASVTSIGDRAFSNFKGLIIVDASNITYSSVDGILFDKAQTKLIQCPVIKKGTYVIPASVTSIGDWAFSDCWNLTSVTIPASVTSIESYAFFACDGLMSIYTNATIPLSIPITVFNYVRKTSCMLYVPIGSKTAYQAAAQWKDFTNIIEMTTDVNDYFGKEPIVYSRNGTLCIENTEVNSIIKVYDVTGKIRYIGKMVDSVMNIELTKGSIYLVQINFKIFKVKL